MRRVEKRSLRRAYAFNEQRYFAVPSIQVKRVTRSASSAPTTIRRRRVAFGEHAVGDVPGRALPISADGSPHVYTIDAGAAR